MLKKEIKNLEYKFLKNFGYNLFGAYSSSFLGNGIDFSEISKYNIGDNLKNIDWKTTAKKDELYVKKFIEEKNLNVLFVINNSDSFNFGDESNKFKLFKEILFILLSCSINNKDNIGAYFYADKIYDYINFNNRNTINYEIIEKLENIKFNPNKANINIVFEKIIKQKIKKTLIIVLTDETDLENNKNIKLISAQNTLVLINIFDFLEINLSQNNELLSLKDKNKNLNIDLNNQKKVLNYKNLILQKLNNQKKNLNKYSAKYDFFITGEDIYKKLYNFLGN